MTHGDRLAETQGWGSSPRGNMGREIATIGNTEVIGMETKGLEDFVSFTIGNQMFGIPILKVQDIRSLENITAIPLAPHRVKGSINLRGRIVTLVSVRVCLGMAERTASEDGEKLTDMGITIEHDNDLYTLLVDSIGDVISLSADLLEDIPGTLDKVWREFSLGVYRLEGALMVVLDLEKLLELNNG